MDFSFFKIGHYKKVFFLFILFGISIEKNVSQDLRDILNAGQSDIKDTLILTLQEADEILLKQNLLLYAQQMNINEAFAYVVQARLWDNPGLYVETNPRNQITHKSFYYVGDRVNADGVYVGNDIVTTLDQIIKTAGKRRNLIHLNNIGAQISEDEFYDLIRSLKYAMRSNYYLLLQYQQGIDLLQTELKSLNYLIEKINIEVKLGNIPLKDFLRLKALAFELENSVREFATEQRIAESNLKTILRLPAKTQLIAVRDTSKLQKVTLAPIDSVAATAMENRYDLKVLFKRLEAAETNYKLQRSLAYPDVDLGVTYTNYSNYIPNYVGVLVRVDLPAWNRNQGNIKAAEYSIEEQKAIYENQMRQAFNDLTADYSLLLNYQDLYFEIRNSFERKYDTYFTGLIRNYEQHTIGLIEFISFFESYRDTKLGIFNLEQDFLEAKEQLNYDIGKDIF